MRSEWFQQPPKRVGPDRRLSVCQVACSVRGRYARRPVNLFARRLESYETILEENRPLNADLNVSG